MTVCARSLSHFPRSSSANRAFAHEPIPSPSSVRERVKSHKRFPRCSQFLLRLQSEARAERTLLQRQHFGRDETKHLGEVGHGCQRQ